MKDKPVLAAHLNVHCLDMMLEKPRRSFDWLRFDSNDDCNLHCVYCHNSRSKRLFDLPVFERFLRDNVEQIANFQFGCRMEPTLDSRLVDFMEVLHASAARPRQSVVLQTNATLLHRHDGERKIAAGLTDIQMSVDTLNTDVFASLRGGARIEKILRNMQRFSTGFPDVAIKFIVTVAKSNLPYIAELVAFGADIGVKAVVVREMFHIPGSARVDDEKMARLLLDDGEFLTLTQQLQEKFSEQLNVNCIDSTGLLLYNAGVQTYSYQSQK